VEFTLFSAETLRFIGIVLLGAMITSLFLAALLFFFVLRKLRRINVPVGAGFGETLLYTPFSLVLFIDLLDWGLDVLAAPITWVVLDRFGLRALRNVSTIEALIPFTQPIPTLTMAWIWVRLFGYESQILDNGDKYVYEQPHTNKR
jgi:hypothetical protein